MDEQQLIDELKAGSEGAYREVVDQYQQMVLNTCLGFIPIRQDAEDLCQEVFIELFRSVGSFREEARLSTWIYRISVTKCLELIRFRKRKKRVAFFQSLVGLEDQRATNLTDPFDHPGIKLENKERAQVLYQHIDKLSENQRVAFTLHKVENMSHKEISRVMGVSVSAVESLLHRARRNLRKSLERFYLEHL